MPVVDSLVRVNTTKREDDENEMGMLLPGTASGRFSSESELRVNQRWKKREE